MILDISTLFLQQYWWFIVSVLAGLLVFLLFVQGGQTLLYTLAKNDEERSLLVNSLGRKWEFTFTTLVTFGGAFFASFPLFYATSFGGAYWLWICIFFCFVIQAVSYEYRKKPGNVFGARTFEIFLFINGAVGTFLLGIAVASLFTGAAFTLDPVTKSVSWEHHSRGLEALLNTKNLLLGAAVLFLSRVLGILYFINNVSNEAISRLSKQHLLYNALPFVLFFVLFLVFILLSDGYSVNPENGNITVESFKYWKNLMAMPFVLILLLLGVVSVLWGIAVSLFKESKQGIWFSGSGVILVVVMLLLMLGYNKTAFYPSTVDIQSSLTIYNASSSHYTLKAMSIVSLLIPFVFAYIFYAWKSINKTPIDSTELQKEEHKY